ncbi:MAG: Peptide/nickel transport system substrate-binding protein [Stygiobacter sp.]|nr:MAG: Peptide/nickel transport system substrate-binding protein [Stygiobacter sp.]KAF0217080.1 MAG: Peptide/nickel transport system substrate-binding [Ignavibacteria bacterium]
MSRLIKSCITLLSVICLTVSCTEPQLNNHQAVVIGLDSDVTTLNPLYVSREAEANISELIYLALVGYDWDSEKGEVISYPLLAKKIEWNGDSSSVLITIRDDIKWSDGDKVTTDDIVYSFDLYSDPKVQSRFYGIFNNYYLNQDLSIDLEKAFKILSPTRLEIKFKPNVPTSTFDFDMPILPKHLFKNIKREELATSDIGFKPIGCGPYLLSSWDRNQSIQLVKNAKSVLVNGNTIDKIIFKIIPDYNSRINQLRKGEIDITENISPEDMRDLKSDNDIVTIARRGREYDYLGLKNVGSEKENQGSNQLFGNKNIRKALSFALNRESILKEYLLGNGELMTGPIAPIFKSSFNSDLISFKYDLQKAKELLQNEGWKDNDGDGVIEKDGKKFEFTLSIPSGNPLRNYSATIFQNNLKAVGLDVKINTLEPAVFFEKMFNKELEAWIAGWMVPIPLDLKPYWYSDAQIAQANVYGYKNLRVDWLLNNLEKKLTKSENANALREFQQIIYDEQPALFLFWIDNMVGYNKRIKNMKINPLGAVQKCWTWELAQ